jgi:hypothetical protein
MNVSLKSLDQIVGIVIEATCWEDKLPNRWNTRDNTVIIYRSKKEEIKCRIRKKKGPLQTRQWSG